VLEGEEMLVKSRVTNLEPEPLRIQGRKDEQVSTTMIVGRTENQERESEIYIAQTL
jgi:hypothetical protein